MSEARHKAQLACRPALRDLLSVRSHLPARGKGAALALPFAELRVKLGAQVAMKAVIFLLEKSLFEKKRLRQMTSAL